MMNKENQYKLDLAKKHYMDIVNGRKKVHAGMLGALYRIIDQYERIEQSN